MRYRMAFYGNGPEFALNSDEKLQAAAADPQCRNARECAAELERRRSQREADRIRGESVRAELLRNPFDPRREVSGDGRHIASRVITHMWIIFILLPIVFGILFAVLTAK
jgi:hypothetical protein